MNQDLLTPVRAPSRLKIARRKPPPTRRLRLRFHNPPPHQQQRAVRPVGFGSGSGWENVSKQSSRTGFPQSRRHRGASNRNFVTTCGGNPHSPAEPITTSEAKRGSNLSLLRVFNSWSDLRRTSRIWARLRQTGSPTFR